MRTQAHKAFVESIDLGCTRVHGCTDTTAMGTPNRNGKVRSRKRLVTPLTHILGRALVDWMGR